mmetsp:Transcript_24231/g.37352  ORF Transcript_24231/g.37352 Transcript_24231/m.37352 type:complete len:212 (+) Transcript_24231:419-1054(+)
MKSVAELFEGLSDFLVNKMVGDFVVLTHDHQSVFLHHLLIREAVVLSIRVLDEASEISHSIHLGLQVLPLTDEELQRDLSVGLVDGDFNDHLVSHSVHQVQAGSSEQAVSAAQVQLHISPVHVLAARGEILVLGVGALHHGKALLVSVAANVLELLSEDWSARLPPEHGDALVFLRSKEVLGEANQEDSQGHHLEPVVFPVPRWLVREESQ